MPAQFTHNNYYIDVHITRRASYDRESFLPTVEVGQEGGNDVVNIGTSREFADEKAAEAWGFELGKDWIDKKGCSSRHSMESLCHIREQLDEVIEASRKLREDNKTPVETRRTLVVELQNRLAKL